VKATGGQLVGKFSELEPIAAAAAAAVVVVVASVDKLVESMLAGALVADAVPHIVVVVEAECNIHWKQNCFSEDLRHTH
jgi:hypothetical protein